MTRVFEPAPARQPVVQHDAIGGGRSHCHQRRWAAGRGGHNGEILDRTEEALEPQADDLVTLRDDEADGLPGHELAVEPIRLVIAEGQDRKSTRLNSSHQISSYAVFCLK